MEPVLVPSITWNLDITNYYAARPSYNPIGCKFLYDTLRLAGLDAMPYNWLYVSLYLKV